MDLTATSFRLFLNLRRTPCLWLIGLILSAGCGGSHQVKPDVAQETLKKALEAWKNGQTVDSLRNATPPIVVQDMDWSGGSQLMDFQIVDGGQPVDANLYAKVKLKLKDSSGTESERTVTYVVGTSPALTVFRDMMR